MDQPRTVTDYIAHWRRLGAQLALVAGMLCQGEDWRGLKSLPDDIPPAMEQLYSSREDLEDLEALLIAEMWELEEHFPGRN